MRKSVLFLATSVVVLSMFSFTSCKKKDGVFNPEERLYKVHYQSSVHHGTTGETKIDPKELRELWRWDKKKLAHIESGRGWIMYFTYEGNQVSKIEIGEEKVINFSYDKTDLTKIEVLDAKSRSEVIITIVERDDRKILKFTSETFSYDDDSKMNKNLCSQLLSIMQIVFSDHTAQTVCENITSAKAHKANSSTISTIELTYVGNNVEKQKVTETIGGVSISKTTVFEYDSKKNPYYEALHFLYAAALSGQSENNVVRYYDEDDHDNVETSVKYEYEYSGDYPSKRTTKFEQTNIMGSKDTYSEVYFYEYQQK